MVPLKFVVTDPPPSRGQSEPTEWRVNIESNGSVWWSTGGTLSSRPTAGGPFLVDTVSLQWQTPAASNLPPGTSELRLTALATDGEGATGADFVEANVESVPLSSGGLWWVDPLSPTAFYHLPNGASNPVSFERPLLGAAHIVHLDGQSILLLGETNLSAWAIPNGLPSAEPSWTISAPLVQQTGPIRFIRRAPLDTPGEALAYVGWPDRVQSLNADGLVFSTWLLDIEETLLDAAVLDGQLVCLVRTTASELRLVRFEHTNGARLGSITWTPEASGTMGVNGMAWLLSIDGDPVALESDGTFRRWYQEADGKTGLQSGALAGDGEITAAGRLESGVSWFSRSGTYRMETEWNQELVHPAPILVVAEDRANSLLWVLEDPEGTEPQWQRLNAQNWTEVPSTLLLQTGAHSAATLSHNRTGPL